MKNNKNGITLIALVITIIVLLILAGISISLVTGQNGVLTRAEDASSTYSISSAKEQANMRAAGYVSEYMEKVYVGNDMTVGAMTTGEYVLSQINGKEDGDYSYSVSGSTITVTSKTTGETLASGTIDDNGGIGWSDTVASGGNTNNQGNQNNTNTSTEEIIQMPETVAEITPIHYGQYIDLGTSILPKTGDTITLKLEGNEQPLADWRVFLKDSDGVWLMLADYMPSATTTSNFSIEGVGLDTGDSEYHMKYGVYVSDSNRTRLINGLNGTIAGKLNWNGLINGSTVAGKSGVFVKGAVDLNQWITSWNANSEYSQLSAIYYQQPVRHVAVASGYKIAGGYKESDRAMENIDGMYSAYVNVDSTINSRKYDDTLYFPHHTFYNFDGTERCASYWLASPSAYYDGYVMCINYAGMVTLKSSQIDEIGVRPVVFLPSNIELDNSGTVCKIKN